MNKVKIYTFVGTVKELKERLAERVEEEEKMLKKYTPYDRAVWRAKKQKETAQENIRKVNEALDEQQKAETMESLKEIVKPVEKFLEDYYKMFPSKRPIEDIKRRPFDSEMCDREYELERDSEDYNNRREEFETRL